jgi:hypothetical protein
MNRISQSETPDESDAISVHLVLQSANQPAFDEAFVLLRSPTSTLQ